MENIYSKSHHDLVETWKQFRLLVNRYQLTKDHSKGQKSYRIYFLLPNRGRDIREMIGNQYSTYYTGAMMTILIKAGYANDSRIEKDFQWLLKMHHTGGWWIVPIQTHDLTRERRNKITSEYAEPLNSLSLLGISRKDPDLEKALVWFIEHQKSNCLWDLTYKNGESCFKDTQKNRRRRWWLALNV